MVKVQYIGSDPVTVEGFPKADDKKDIKRTFEGALHLKPGKLYNLSKAEWAYLKEKRKDLKFQQFKTGEKAIRQKEKKGNAVSTNNDAQSAVEKNKSTSFGFNKDKKK